MIGCHTHIGERSAKRRKGSTAKPWQRFVAGAALLLAGTLLAWIDLHKRGARAPAFD